MDMSGGKSQKPTQQIRQPLFPRPRRTAREPSVKEAGSRIHADSLPLTANVLASISS